MEFGARLKAAAAATDDVLDRALAELASRGRAPERLIAATRHALLGGGKRFRPFLVLEVTALLSGPRDAAAVVGAGFECLHAYSLVHDDLPAMDDDDMRRGRPTVHKAYDDATAILVGDGLQAMAFELVTAPPVPSAAAGALAHCLAGAAGLNGMVGGQYRDLNALGLDAGGVRTMQAMKTGALIRAACEAGAIVAGAGEERRERFARFGAHLGEAFQLADDLLDLEGSIEETGKRVGKDAAGGKATIPALLGPAAARERLSETLSAAVAELHPFGAGAAPLTEAARFVAERRS